ncbi:hypothetical protein FHW04_004533 [Pantoea sp. AN62]
MKKPAGAGLEQRLSDILAARRASFADLAALSACFNGPFRTVPEISSACLTAFPSGFCRPLRIFGKVAGTTTAY